MTQQPGGEKSLTTCLVILTGIANDGQTCEVYTALCGSVARQKRQQVGEPPYYQKVRSHRPFIHILNDRCNGGVVRLAVTYLQFPIQVCFSATIGHPMQQSPSSGFLL